MRRLLVLLALAVALPPSKPAGAVDGVKLIVPPKNPSAFPIVISAPGSYRLKKNIEIQDPNTTAISITADDVTLDLNGFEIIGATVCAGSPATCSNTGDGVGINSSNRNVTVTNGTVRGMGQAGVSIDGPFGRVERVRAFSNGAAGILCSTGCVVRWNITDGNGNPGGIEVAGNGCIVTGNTSSGNHGDGILTAGACTISENTVTNNGNDGIFSQDGSSILGNIVRSNVSWGLDILDSPHKAAYAGNELTGNHGGTEVQVNGGTEIGPNFCGTDTTCP
jgi:parallel beta-helix repeat protein